MDNSIIPVDNFFCPQTDCFHLDPAQSQVGKPDNSKGLGRNAQGPIRTAQDAMKSWWQGDWVSDTEKRLHGPSKGTCCAGPLNGQ